MHYDWLGGRVESATEESLGSATEKARQNELIQMIQGMHSEYPKKDAAETSDSKKAA